MVWNLLSKTCVSLSIYLSLFTPLSVFAETADSKIQQGISQYHEGDFKNSGESFSSARAERPNDSRIAYNQGNAHFREGKFEDALKAFNQSAMDEQNATLRKNAIYNTGNTLVKLEKLEDAESAYKKVLTLDPTDMDAKFNLEYVRQQLKQKEEEKKDSKQGEQNNEDSSSKSDKGEDQEQNKDGEQQDQDSESPPPPSENAESEQNEDSEEQPGEQSMEAEISQEEAERMLDGLNEDLKSISRMQAGKTKSTYQGNDW